MDRIVITSIVVLLGGAACKDQGAAGAGSGSAAATAGSSPASGSGTAPMAAAIDLPTRNAPHTPEVLAKFEAACDAGKGGACFDSGMRHAMGMGAARDRVVAVTWLEKGCKLDDYESCGILAGFISLGEEGVPKDEKRAFEIHQRICPKRPESCALAADYFHDGLVVAKDLAKSLALLEQGCTAGDGRSCEHLANDLANGTGAAPDPKRAAEMAKKACDLAPERCETLGAFYIAGTGVTKDHDKGVGYVDKACKAGSKKACDGLEILNGAR